MQRMYHACTSPADIEADGSRQHYNTGFPLCNTGSGAVPSAGRSSASRRPCYRCVHARVRPPRQRRRYRRPSVRSRASSSRDMNLLESARDEPRAHIDIAEPTAERCPSLALPPEGNVKLRNYRMLNENLRAYTPTGDVHTSPGKGKLVSRFDVCTTISPPRARILELVRPEDPGCEALEAIVRPAPRRGLTRPLDEDTRRFLQRALCSPSPYVSTTVTPEPPTPLPKPPALPPEASGTPSLAEHSQTDQTSISSAERSLADELREAEEDEQTGCMRQELLREFQRRGVECGAQEAVERERLGRLALSVEEDEVAGGVGGAGSAGAGLCAAARRLDALLAESRALHDELAGIQQDLQTQSARACRCAAAARVLLAETRSLRYLDDVVALLRGDVKAAVRARAWPFAIGRRTPGRNYIV